MQLTGILPALAFAAGLPGLCSCSLIFHGTSEQIQVNSDPPGATVTLHNGESAVTPFSLTVPRNEDLQLHFSKPGYQSADLTDDTLTDRLMPLDLIPFMLPWAIDLAAGAGTSIKNRP